MRRAPRRMRRIGKPAALALAAVMLAGCGPTVDLSIRVRQEAADVLYGAPTAPPAPPLKPRSGPVAPSTNAPGFIAPPVFVNNPPGFPSQPTDGGAPTTGVPGKPPVVAPPVACPTAPADATPAEAAPTVMKGAPAAGTYVYRRSGALKTAANDTALVKAVATPLSPELKRTIRNVQSVPLAQGGEQTTYEVVSEERGIVSTTSYFVVPPAEETDAGGTGPTGGVYIRSIETKVTGTDGRPTFDSFQPTPPVKLFDLPFVPQTFDTTTRGGRSVDPVTGATIEVYYATEGQVTVDLCGTLHRGWRVRLGQEKVGKQGPNPVRCNYNVPAKQVAWQFTGTLDVLPQFGGLIATDNLHFFEGSDDKGQRFDLTSDSSLTSLTPTAPMTSMAP